METGIYHRELTLNKLKETIRTGVQLLQEITEGVNFSKLPNRFERVLGAYLVNQSHQATLLLENPADANAINAMFRDHVYMVYLVDALLFDAKTGEPEEEEFRERFNFIMPGKSVFWDDETHSIMVSRNFNPWFNTKFSPEGIMEKIRTDLSRTVYKKLIHKTNHFTVISSSTLWSEQQEQRIPLIAEPLVTIFKGVLLALSLISIPKNEWKYYTVRIRIVIEEIENRFLVTDN